MRGLALFLSLVLMPLSFSAAFAEDQNGSAQTLFAQAQQLRNEGRFAEAEDALLQALQEEPSNPDYHFELSNIYAALYDTWQTRPNARQAMELLNRSQRELEQVLVFQPDHLAARFNLGVVYKRQGRYEAAREEFRRVLELSPDLAAAWYQIGSTYQDQGFWDEAEDAYLKARDLSYDPYAINDALEELRRARVAAEQSSERPSGFGGMMGGGGYPSNSNSLDPFGRPTSVYDSVSGQANQNPNASSMFPSLAAMMIQQVLSRGPRDES